MYNIYQILRQYFLNCAAVFVKFCGNISQLKAQNLHQILPILFSRRSRDMTTKIQK